jgi:hypothetical protein
MSPFPAKGPSATSPFRLRGTGTKLILSFVVLALALGASPSLDAKPRRAKSSAKRSAPKGAGPSSGGAGESALADAKIAVLPFEGEDPEQLRKHVIKVLVERGFQVNSTLKLQDNPTQYRDMGAALNLAVYVHGKLKPTSAEHATATVTIRSAVTGRPVATATFNGFRRGLPYDVEEKLWDRVGPAFRRACVEATKPNRRHSTPLYIEAGTPL